MSHIIDYLASLKDVILNSDKTEFVIWGAIGVMIFSIYLIVIRSFF